MRTNDMRKLECFFAIFVQMLNICIVANNYVVNRTEVNYAL